MIRLVKYTVFALLILVVGMVFWWFGPARQGEAVVEAVLSGVEKHLAVDVQVGEVSCEFWRHFPSVGVLLESVQIDDALAPGQAFLDVQQMDVRFNLWDIIRGKYAVQRVVIQGGTLDLLSTPEGDNWHFWKDAEGPASPFQLALPDVRLEGVELTGRFIQKGSSTSRFSASIGVATAQLEYTDGSWDIHGGINARSVQFSMGTAQYVDFDDLNAHIAVAWNGPTKTVEVAFEAETGGVDFQGDVRHGEGGFDMNLRGTKTDLQAVRPALPPFILASLEGLEMAGLSDFEVSLSQSTSANSITWDVRLVPHRVEIAAFGQRLDDVSGALRLSPQGELIRIDFTEARARWSEGALTLNGSWTGSEHWGKLDADVAWSGHVMALAGALKSAGHALAFLDRIEGQIEWKGHLTGVTSEAATADDWSISGELQTARLVLDETFAPLNAVSNCRINIEGDQIQAQFEAETPGGVLDIFASGPFSRTGWSIVAKADEMDLEALQKSVAARRADSASASVSIGLVGAEDLSVNIDLNITRATHGALILEGLDAKAALLGESLMIQDFFVSMCGGSVLGSAEWSPTDLTAQLQASNLDLHALLEQTDGLGQDVVSADNIYGTAALIGTMNWSARRTQGHELEADFVATVHNGGLQKFELLARIPEAIRGQRSMGTIADADDLQRRLAHVRFAEITHRFTVAEGAIEFEPVHIVSDALDIGIGGRYSFDGGVAYTVDFALRDLRDQRSEFGEVEDDGLGHRFFLGIGGTVDDPEFWYDRSAHNAFRKARRQSVFSGTNQPPDAKLPPKPNASVAGEGTDNESEDDDF